MKRALAVSAHVAHVALLLIAALDDARDHQSPAHARTGPVQPHDVATAGVINRARSADGAPHCPMPVWRPDPAVRYAAMVIGVDPAAAGPRPAPAPCVNSYSHAVTPR